MCINSRVVSYHDVWDLRYAICSVPFALCHLRRAAPVSSAVGSLLWDLPYAFCALFCCFAIFALGSTLCYLRSTLLLCNLRWAEHFSSQCSSTIYWSTPFRLLTINYLASVWQVLGVPVLCGSASVATILLHLNLYSTFLCMWTEWRFD